MKIYLDSSVMFSSNDLIIPINSWKSLIKIAIKSLIKSLIKKIRSLIKIRYKINELPK